MDNLYLTRLRDRLLLRQLLWIAAVALLSGGCLFAITWLQVETLRTAYHVDHLETQLHRLLEVERTWRLEAAYLTDPERIETRAREELGMDRPRLRQLVSFDGIMEWEELDTPLRTDRDRAQ